MNRNDRKMIGIYGIVCSDCSNLTRKRVDSIMLATGDLSFILLKLKKTYCTCLVDKMTQ